MRYCLILFLVLSCNPLILAQGIHGTIKTNNGSRLPYAAIVVKGTSLGTITNDEGQYDLPLKAGTYEVVFHYLGFQALQKTVIVESEFQLLDVILEEQAFRLEELTIGQGKEDPAYTIMRRAIAKSRYHQLQINSYSARIYAKSSITITDLPMEFLYRKQLKEVEKKANFKKGVPMLNETVSDVSFKQPNAYYQRIIATRSSIGEEGFSVNQYFLTSFYRPEVAGAVSPLSPKAFAYYKFEYQGTFQERGVEISKIRVIPRSYGEGVFRGVIYLIENTWALHSLQLETIGFQGLTFYIRQVYSPVQNVWMPINQRYTIEGKVFGISGHAQFIISQTYKDIKVNPAFVEEIQVIDEKKEKPTNSPSNRDSKGQKMENLIAKQKEYSTKNLRKLLNDYEKEEKKQRKNRNEDVTITRSDSVTTDPLADKRSHAFWDSLRTVPLTSAEVKSYLRNDSIKIVREVNDHQDSTSRSNTSGRKSTKKFDLAQIITGNTWTFGKRISLTWNDLITSPTYNTVEGYTLEGVLRLRYLTRRHIPIDTSRKYPDPRRNSELNVSSTGRYEFGLKRMIGLGEVGYRHQTTFVRATGGRYLHQLNSNEPISQAMNTLTTLLFERNLIKLYQKDFIRLTTSSQLFKGRLTLNGGLEYAERTELTNYKENLKPWINWGQLTFTPNRPTNTELGSTAFPVHQAFVFNVSVAGRLGPSQFRIRNGRQVTSRNKSPLLTIHYKKGIPTVGGSDIHFDFLSAELSHAFETGIRSRLSYYVSAGGFLTNKAIYFPDFAHFQGNEFFLQQGNPIAIYRLLPYYQYSTSKRFIDAHVLAEFRKFLITQLTIVRLAGLKENLFVHYLATPASRNYTEVGYALDGLIPGFLPVFRVEVITQWQAWQYQKLGFRIGTTLKFR